MQDNPKISICIPQYGRSKFLLKVLESIREQSYGNIEVVVSDDCSKDDTATVIPAFLAASGLTYKYVRQEVNLGYDANLRAALALGTGEYLLVLGNDDALAYPDAIADLAGAVVEFGRPDMVLVNNRSYADVGGANQFKRVQKTVLLPGGTETALSIYRSFSFVAGIVFRRESFHAHNTAAYDATIFVQVFLATRIVAAGGALLMLDRTIVANNVVVDAAEANSYKDVLRRTKLKVRPHSQGLSSISAVAFAAVKPYIEERELDRVLVQMYKPLLQYTYPYWLYAHRREGFWRAALSMSWGCYPTLLIKDVSSRRSVAAKLIPYYIVSTAAGWLVPTSILAKLQHWGYRRSKHVS